MAPSWPDQGPTRQGWLPAHLARQRRRHLNRNLHWRVIMNTRSRCCSRTSSASCSSTGFDFAVRTEPETSPSSTHPPRSEEHTHELQSLMHISNASCSLKKKNTE